MHGLIGAALFKPEQGVDVEPLEDARREKLVLVALLFQGLT
jgi:hypothetical protein